ncbi:membrane protein insertion efficiency factor YidD [Kalamiella sp. sgz302252]|uniref:membrane protein insertion efficiency factor YidD n=1 Tax=Pantoea sp. sgz302252 TaxID=3341827 RepID=UPI0036D2E1F6
MILLSRASLLLIALYRKYAPASVRERCRYYPSCSAYSLVCIKRFGFIQGWKLAIARLKKCRPPNGGYDFPPGKKR